MNKIIFVFSILMTFTAFGADCTTKKVDSPFAKLEAIADSPFIAQKNCLRSLADAPTTPPISKDYFKKIGNEEVYGDVCYLPDSEQFRSFVFLTDKGVKALKFPIYRLGAKSLPGNIGHFMYEGKDYYIEAAHPGQAKIVTYDQLPILARELIVIYDGGPPVAIELPKMMNKINGEIKKYEDYLKSVGKISAINVSVDSADVETVMPCLLSFQAKAIKLYMSKKFINAMPADATIYDDHHNFDKATEETKQKYARSYDSIRSEIQKDLLSSHPLCVGVIDDKTIEASFEEEWGKRKPIYEGFRKRLGLVSP